MDLQASLSLLRNSLANHYGQQPATYASPGRPVQPPDRYAIHIHSTLIAISLAAREYCQGDRVFFVAPFQVDPGKSSIISQY